MVVGDDVSFEKLKGQGWQRPGLAIAATFCMFSLAGLPPFAGFYGKYMIFKELILQGHVGLAVFGVTASLVSVYYYLRLPVTLFIEKPSEAAEREASERPAIHAPFAGATVLVCGLLVILLGLIPGTIMATFARPAVQATIQLPR